MPNKNLIEYQEIDQEVVDRKEYVLKTFPGLSYEDVNLFLYTCKRSGLDPVFKQIYAIKRNGKMTIQTSIDGLRLIADRSKNYAAGKEPSFTYKEDKTLLSATSYVKKKTEDGVWHEIAATAFYDEYKVLFFNKEKNEWSLSDFWKRMPHVMLAKCAEAIALRKSFPAEMGGIYTSEEMEQADNTLTDKQAKEIENLIGDDEALASRVLKGYERKYKKPVRSFHEIKQEDFMPALQALKKNPNPIQPQRVSI